MVKLFSATEPEYMKPLFDVPSVPIIARGIEQFGEQVPYNTKDPVPRDPKKLVEFWAQLSPEQKELFKKTHPDSVLTQMHQNGVIASEHDANQRLSVIAAMLLHIKSSNMPVISKVEMLGEVKAFKNAVDEFIKPVDKAEFEVHTPPTTNKENEQQTNVSSAEITRQSSNPESREDSSGLFDKSIADLPPIMRKTVNRKMRDNAAKIKKNIEENSARHLSQHESHEDNRLESTIEGVKDEPSRSLDGKNKMYVHPKNSAHKRQLKRRLHINKK